MQEMEPSPDLPATIESGNTLQKLPHGPSWWLAPLRELPPHTRLNDSEYDALFPPCWQKPLHGFVWSSCDQCKARFDQQVGRPSRWICRCGVKDMGWRHRAAPHVDEMCRVCYDLMEAEGIDHVQWSQHVKDEWQASGSTPCGRDVSCVP